MSFYGEGAREREAVAGLIASINSQMSNADPEVQAALVRVKAEMDGWMVQLRLAGLPMTMVGALLFDHLTNVQKMPREAAMTYAMAVLK